MNWNAQHIDSLFWKMALHDDEAAFKTLFVQFFAPLCVFALRYVSDRDVCKDIVQETFYKIWKDRKNINLHSSAKNFLITSVKNTCIDYLRKDESQQTYFQLVTNEKQELGDDLYSINELEEMLSAALARLPEKVRIVFEQNRFEGKTYAAIAEEHQCSVKTIEAYMTKALKHLRKELQDYLPFIVLFL